LITILSACGTGESSSPNATTVKNSGITVDNTWGGFAWEVAKGVDQTQFTPMQIQYPAQGFLAGSPISYLDSIADGVATAESLIPTLGQFVLVGYSQGAQLISEVLQSLQTGALSTYMPMMVAGVTFGNPMRQAGHTWPGDPIGCTGTGINNQALLTSTPDNWWDMTDTYDLAGNIPTGVPGTIINDIWQAAGQVNLVSVQQIMTAISNIANGQSGVLEDIISSLLANPLSAGADLTTAATFLANALINAGTSGHTCFGTTEVGNTGLTFVQLAINYLNSYV
jgi:hypothetical protein